MSTPNPSARSLFTPTTATPRAHSSAFVVAAGGQQRPGGLSTGSTSAFVTPSPNPAGRQLDLSADSTTTPVAQSRFDNEEDEETGEEESHEEQSSQFHDAEESDEMHVQEAETPDHALAAGANMPPPPRAPKNAEKRRTSALPVECPFLMCS